MKEIKLILQCQVSRTLEANTLTQYQVLQVLQHGSCRLTTLINKLVRNTRNAKHPKKHYIKLFQSNKIIFHINKKKKPSKGHESLKSIHQSSKGKLSLHSRKT
ncbi:hypothetical protein V6Z11_D03G059500 [Gossypium hirsutum]